MVRSVVPPFSCYREYIRKYPDKRRVKQVILLERPIRLSVVCGSVDEKLHARRSAQIMLDDYFSMSVVNHEQLSSQSVSIPDSNME